MSRQSVNLENVLDKKVRARRVIIGSIDAISDSTILVASPLGEKYNIPRLHIESGNSKEIQLDISPKQLQRYKIN